jgi:predicted transposase YbfD/YdcC
MNRAPTLEAQFADLTDPRTDHTLRHKLIDIVIIAILAVICGADGWTDVEEFGRAKERWLRKFLELPHGIPSHDTFGRVFARIDAQEFQQCFMSWVQAIHTLTQGQVIAVDGKCLRGTQDTYLGKQAIHMVSAWATADHMVLGQRQVDAKSNEITAVPELLALLDIQGCIVSVDALNCQKKTAAQIVQQGGDYVLALKDNHPHMYEDVRTLFAWAAGAGFQEMDHAVCTQVGKDHGRIETRTCITLSDPECLAMLADHADWVNLRTVVHVHSKREVGSEVSEVDRYYLSSLPSTTPQLAERALDATRSHWGIENQLHWVLDVAFQEDHSRARTGNAGENLAVLRHFALNLLRQEKSSRLSIRAKRLKAGWDDRYLLKLLAV